MRRYPFSEIHERGGSGDEKDVGTRRGAEEAELSEWSVKLDRLGQILHLVAERFERLLQALAQLSLRLHTTDPLWEGTACSCRAEEEEKLKENNKDKNKSMY